MSINFFFGRDSNTTVISDDCQAKGSSHTYTNDKREVELQGTGDVISCMKSVRRLLDSDTPCILDPCSIAGVYQPPIPKHSKFYGISEYWYSTYDVLNLNTYYSYSQTVHKAQVRVMFSEFSSLRFLPFMNVAMNFYLPKPIFCAGSHFYVTFWCILELLSNSVENHHEII